MWLVFAFACEFRREKDGIHVSKSAALQRAAPWSWISWFSVSYEFSVFFGAVSIDSVRGVRRGTLSALVTGVGFMRKATESLKRETRDCLHRDSVHTPKQTLLADVSSFGNILCLQEYSQH